MKKLLFLFIPLVSFGQIIKSETYGEIDIRLLDDKYVTVKVNYGMFEFTTSKYKEVYFSGNVRKKKWNVYDEGELIALTDKADVLNFFAKYNFELSSTSKEVGAGVIVGNVVATSSNDFLIFLNNN